MARGSTVVLTTRYLNEADRLAGRIAVINHGRLIVEGTNDQFNDRITVTTDAVRVLILGPGGLPPAARCLSEVTDSARSVRRSRSARGWRKTVDGSRLLG